MHDANQLIKLTFEKNSDNSKRITDRHIAYVQQTQNKNIEIQSSSGGGGGCDVTNDDSIHNIANIDATNSTNSSKQKFKCDSTNVYNNRGFVGDT